MSERLERVRAELLQARDQGDEGLINDITVELRTWLRRLLEDHPELAEGISEFTGDADQFGEVSKIDIRENTFQGPSAVQGKGTQVNRFGI
ncbi:hypothetical protein [Streptomyces sp. NPDC048650]|uniref:hypothetical protein n=1 Tax=unclassified Streptomyces TaxID=2593676 RepID=UPI003713DE4E